MQATGEQLACLLADGGADATAAQRHRDKLFSRLVKDVKKHYYPLGDLDRPNNSNKQQHLLYKLKTGRRPRARVGRYEFFPRVALRMHALGLFREVHRRHMDEIRDSTLPKAAMHGGFWQTEELAGGGKTSSIGGER